ncbi:hypothetical protein HanRHA438_Chr14g0658581 [Helianthus annuus]|uniref:Uncharacterized protein n=1 Tax=Helianthus annuus TaxID=4232 RepID=A0A251SI09_HELAN|nr:hypothetical protein HanXRQr2_Chr14g0647991 [Helianthus annuus]KAJ0444881.1 hypothetical protein HanIR_Chr16g0836621 [Helianthus annuus]KAJ0464446.1 hypothetical protein HanHA300_Chr14g0527311 [Helianthus annuus]KAJ0468980.1 hypothetical protein HanIR_Chr14g0702811 [Helianthus annuus]KAJ0486024.1 hypothetical protein HanHA89_Chr14g0575031 [Helianthus annuus]
MCQHNKPSPFTFIQVSIWLHISSTRRVKAKALFFPALLNPYEVKLAVNWLSKYSNFESPRFQIHIPLKFQIHIPFKIQIHYFPAPKKLQNPEKEREKRRDDSEPKHLPFKTLICFPSVIRRPRSGTRFVVCFM